MTDWRNGLAQHPTLDEDGLPDIEWAARRQRIEAAQPGWERWHDDHSQYMRNFMHQATGLVPGLHSAQNAYDAWTDPEHPITQEGSSIPKALGWGALGLAEAGIGPLAGLVRREQLAEGLFSGEATPLGTALGSAVGAMGLAPKTAPRHAESSWPLSTANRQLDPETTTLNSPGLPTPRPRRDAAADLPAPTRPLPDLKVHTEPIETYHGTAAQEPFTRFDKNFSRDFGIHSGTPKAADEFVAMGRAGEGRVLPMNLGPQDRPFTSLEVKDLGTWQPLAMVRELEKRGVRFSDQEFADILASVRKIPVHGKQPGYSPIENALNRHGVDALRYKNGAEDPGSTSWITWNPETLYSRTSGAQLYNLPPIAGAGAATADYIMNRLAERKGEDQ